MPGIIGKPSIRMARWFKSRKELRRNPSLALEGSILATHVWCIKVAKYVSCQANLFYE